jgi:hypothetical protein
MADRERSVTLNMSLARAQAKTRELEHHLAARDDEIAELKTEVRRLREREAASRAALDTLKRMLQARSARQPVTAAARMQLGSIATLSNRLEEAQPEPLPPPPAGGAAAEKPPGPDERIKEMDEALTAEQQKRQEAEAELQRLREETAVGPFGDSVKDELRASRRKVQGLEAALVSAQRARDELAEKYKELRAQMEARNAASDANGQAQVQQLKDEQQRVLMSFEEELNAGRARENELREALAAAQSGADDPPLALVADLRAENEALRARLEEEHQRNRVLSGKLKMASRVADMIFKVQMGQQVATPQ